MMQAKASEMLMRDKTAEPARRLFREHQQLIYQRTDRLFAALMCLQWLASIGIAIWISPKIGAGPESQIHPPVWAAVFLGSAISLLPVILGLTRSGATSTRHIIAIGQMMMGMLLIYLTGGRIETDFHIFGSLAFLAFYRDWRVLVPGTLVVVADHLLLGLVWPHSVYDLMAASHWRGVEYIAWVIFEDAFLIMSCLHSQKGMRSRAEQRAERYLSERRHRSLITAISQVVWTTDADGRVEDIPQWRAITGQSEEEVRDFGWLDAVHPDDRERVTETMNEALRTTTVYEAEYRVQRVDGNYRHYSARGVPVVENGIVQEWVGLCWDITVGKQAEAALREYEEQYRDFFENAHDIIYTHDLEGNYTSVNKACERITGYTQEESLKMNLAQVVSPESLKIAEKMRSWKISEKSPSIYELEIITKDGRIATLEVNSRLTYRDGQPSGVQGIARDISDRKRVEAELEKARDAALESARLKSEFLANMSHEIRTPMNGVIGMTGLLLDTELTTDQRELAETISSSGDALLTIINDILDFSKMEAGKLQFERLDFDLGNAVEGTVESLAERAFEKKIELASLIHSDVTTKLCGDPGRLRQVLTNLIGNALKFTERGEVIVQAEKESETDNEVVVRFSVSDTGIGIVEAVQRNLFQAFTQADGSTTRKYGGTGLGLAISKQLVELMGGQIGLTSTPGQGSTFWFTARFDKQPAGSVADKLVVKSLERLRVLIVDDNATNRKILTHQLTSWGMIPEAADSGARALELLRAAVAQGTAYDLAILDFMMREMDGFELARAIKADAAISGMQLVLLTSYGQRGDGTTARETGVAAYLTKPVRQSVLFNCLARVMSPPLVVSDRPAAPAALKSDLVTKHSLKETKTMSQKLVLVAEDNMVNQKITVRQLQKLGYRADAVADGREALEALTKIPYDIVLMDCQMPEMDGYDATVEIRRRERNRKHTMIVAMTAHALDGDREKCLSVGMDDYIAKPVKAEDLAKVLERVSIAAGDSQSHKVMSPEVVAPVDLNRLYESMGQEPEELLDILGIYLDQMSHNLKRLDAALESEDADEIDLIAHNCCGVSANCGMTAVVAPLRELERMGRENCLQGSKVLGARVSSEFERIKVFLDENLAHLAV